jgi:hypothetical protein
MNIINMPVSGLNAYLRKIIYNVTVDGKQVFKWDTNCLNDEGLELVNKLEELFDTQALFDSQSCIHQCHNFQEHCCVGCKPKK